MSSRIDFTSNMLNKFTQQRSSLQFTHQPSSLSMASKVPKRPTSKQSDMRAQIKPDIVDFFKLKYQPPQQKHYDNKLISQSKSQENMFKNSHHSLDKPLYSPKQRQLTEEMQKSKRTIPQSKQLFLALNQKQELKNTSTQQKINLTAGSNQETSKRTSFQTVKMKTLQDESKESYLFDTQMLKNAQFIQDEYIRMVSSNKVSLLSQDGEMIKQQIDSPQMKQIHKQSQFLSQDGSEAVKRFSDSPIMKQKPKQPTLNITLSYKNQKFQFQMEYLDRNCQDLFHYLQQKIIEIESQNSGTLQVEGGAGTGSIESDNAKLDINRICQFYSVQKNIPLDYYLSLPSNLLVNLLGQQLFLQPLYSIPCGKRVGLKDFILLKCIGVGGFSRVYMVRKRDTGKFFALKLIDKKFILDNQKEIIVQNERDIMAKMDNDFITPLHFAFETKFYIAFVLEYCSGGELFYHLRKLRRLSEADAKFYFVEICIGMAYLHSKGIVYRDIKPENILLDLQGHLLLSDFGLSKPNMSPDNFAYSFCGSPEYMAPEMLLKTGHNFLVDCYCLGALLYELVTGLPPFYSHNTQEIYNSILTEEIQFPSYVTLTPPLRELIQKLLQKEPNLRLGTNGGVVEILTHEWFKDVDFQGIVGHKIKPPYSPEPLKYNFDEEEFNKGDVEFRKQYTLNLQKEYSPQDTQSLVLKNFYYSRDANTKPNVEIIPSKREQIQGSISLQAQVPEKSIIQINKLLQKQNQLYFSVDQTGKSSSQQRLGKTQVKSINPQKSIKTEQVEYFSKNSGQFNVNNKIMGGHGYSKTVQMAVFEVPKQNNERINKQPSKLSELRIKTETTTNKKISSASLRNDLNNLPLFLEKSKSTKNQQFKKFI